MASPKEVIEAIRTELGIGLQTDAKAEIAIKRWRGMTYRALETIAEDLYSKQNHFVLELIQNADDNEYVPSVTPFLSFKIDKEKIVVQNNETGFKDDNVRALCDIGQSTKTKTLGYIGEKGIGFKSVFRISDRPQIFSNGFNFEFRKDDGENNFGFIVPHWISESPQYVSPELTNIVLPLRQLAGEEISKFGEIEPILLLFLRNLRAIEVHDDGTLVTRIERHDKNGRVRLSRGDYTSHWKIVSLAADVPPQISEEKREGVQTRNIVLAFPLNSSGSANTNEKQDVFAYLPTRAYGFKFIIQADFLVPASREDIHKNKSWNRWIRDCIPKTFCEAVEEFKEDVKLQVGFYNYIPLASEVTDPFFSSVVTQIHNSLREADCVLTESRHWLKPGLVFRADDDIRALIPNADLQRLFGREYVSRKIIAALPVLDALGVAEFGLSELIECLKNIDWLGQQSDEWFLHLYGYLSKQLLNRSQVQELKNLSILRLTRNRLTSIGEGPGTVFLPLDKKGGYAFEAELRIMKRSLCEPKNKELKAPVVAFLRRLGVVDAQPYEIIERHILPEYIKPDDKGNWKNKDEEVRIDYVRYIKDHLRGYLKERSQQKRITEQESLRHLTGALWLRFVKSDNSWHSKAESLYLGKAYGNDNDLEKLFDGLDDENIRFLHEQYVQQTLDRLLPLGSDISAEEGAKKREQEVRAWQNFFVTLGLETRIRVSRSGDGASLEFASKDLKTVIQSADKTRITKAIKILDEHWKGYGRVLNAGYPHAPRKSEFHKLIAESAWIPTNQEVLAKPSDVFIDKPEIKKILGRNATYLGTTINDKDFLKALGINAELTVAAVLNHLKAIVDSRIADQSTYEQIYRFLDRHFDAETETIRREFSHNRLIYVPGSLQLYYSSVEVLWKDASEICGNTFGYLARHYPKLRSFFVESLEISERPGPQDYAVFLERLTEKESVTEVEEKSILRVYEELNRGLNPDETNPLISDELWWASLIRKPIFWTRRREFWSNEGDVLVANDPELYALFEASPRLGFLKLGSNYHLKIRHFLEAAGIPCVDQIVRAKVLLQEIPTIDEEITSQIRFITSFILRYLFQVHIAAYEVLKANGTLDQLVRLTCYSVENLQVEYSVLDESVTAAAKAFLHEGNLYVEAGEAGETDYLAIELAKHFESPPGLEDFLISLFEKKTEDKILRLFTAKRIGALPPGELEHFGIGGLDGLPATVKAAHLDEVTQAPELSYDTDRDDTVDAAEEEQIVENCEEIIDEEPEDLERAEQTASEFSTAQIGPVTPESKTSGTHGEGSSHGNGAKPTDSHSLLPRTPKASPDRGSQRQRSTARPLATGSQAPSDGVKEKTDWKPECEPEEADIRAEEFQANRKEFREAQRGNAGGDLVSTATSTDTVETDGPSDGLTHQAKRAIGSWGERYVMSYLREEFVRKYTGTKVQTTFDGFNVWEGEDMVVQVHWLNRVADLGGGHDIKVRDHGTEIFIEVKSTKTPSKEWFDVSRKQWEFAERHQDNFYLYRVFNAGTKQARLIEIKNPYDLWATGRLLGYPIRVFV